MVYCNLRKAATTAATFASKQRIFTTLSKAFVIVQALAAQLFQRPVRRPYHRRFETPPLLVTRPSRSKSSCRGGMARYFSWLAMFQYDGSHIYDRDGANSIGLRYHENSEGVRK